MKFILTFLFFCGVSGQTFKSNGYEDLVVAIHPDVSVSSDHQQIIVDNLKVSFNACGQFHQHFMSAFAQIFLRQKKFKPKM
jgi:hypothetical protein